jgi:hypothetical protein
MKKNLLILLLSLGFIWSCEESEAIEVVNVARPEYMAKDAFKSSAKILAPAPIIESGKIYAYKNLVLINDVNKGIHVIDNSNPNNPVKLAFINIIGNKDMEIKGDYLYADSLMDLLVFNISSIGNISEVTRLEDVFPSYIAMPMEENLYFDYGDDGLNPGEIIVGWTITEERMNQEYIANNDWDGNVIFNTAMAAAESTGEGGSLARFKIVSDYLYAVDSHNINIFDISNLNSPIELNDVFAGFDIETIFNRGDHLFLGSMSGMYIYDISAPSRPEFVSEFQHGTACDPVVVDDNYAYITLRAGNFCGALESSLEIVDISDIHNLKRVKSYSMNNPYGLGIKDQLLFICDGTSGLKVYNKTDVENLELIKTFSNITTFDVIPLSSHLLLIGENALYQYKYSDDGIELLSQFSLN